jgi:hypothetical protein
MKTINNDKRWAPNKDKRIKKKSDRKKDKRIFWLLSEEVDNYIRVDDSR